MIIKRKLFSKEGGGKKDNKLSKKDKTVGAGVAVGAAVGLNKLAHKSASHFGDKLMNGKLTASDADTIKSKLLKNAKSQGIKVVEDSGAQNAAYTGSKASRAVRNGIAKVAKVLKKKDPKKSREFVSGIREAVENGTGMSRLYDNLGKDAIVVGKSGVLSGADVISHELGHAQYMHSGRGKNIVTKAAHKAAPISKIAITKAGIGLSAAHGFKSGVKSQRLKEEGKKESRWNKVKSVALPAAAVAPLLIAEGGASWNGLKRMKKLGASKKLLQ